MTKDKIIEEVLEDIKKNGPDFPLKLKGNKGQYWAYSEGQIRECLEQTIQKERQRILERVDITLSHLEEQLKIIDKMKDPEEYKVTCKELLETEIRDFKNLKSKIRGDKE